MQFIDLELQALPEYKALAGRLEHFHTFGEGNPVSDAASRGKYALVAELCAQHGVNARRLEIPVRAVDFMNRLRAQARLNVDKTS